MAEPESCLHLSGATMTWPLELSEKRTDQVTVACLYESLYKVEEPW